MKRLFSLILALIIFFLPAEAFASSSINASSGSAYIGETVTVYISFSGDGELIGAIDAHVEYNSGVLQYTGSSNSNITNGGSGEIRISYFDTSGSSSVSVSLYFDVIGPGGTNVSLSTDVLASPDEESIAGGSGSVYISTSKAPDPDPGTGGGDTPGGGSETPGGGTTPTPSTPDVKSSDASLRYLAISCGSLSPGFSSTTYDYTVHASKDETDCSITAEPTSSKASVWVSGSSTLSADDVTRVVTVTAEDGTQREYAIHIVRDRESKEDEKKEEEKDDGKIRVEVNGKKYIVSDTPDSKTVPGGFTLGSAKLGEKTIKAFKNSDGSIKLVQLIPEVSTDSTSQSADSSQNASSPTWFIFNEKDSTFSPAEIIEIGKERFLVTGKNLSLVYGEKDGKAGYFIQDAATGELTFISFEEQEKEPAPEEVPDKLFGIFERDKLPMYITLGVASLLLLAVLIVQIVILSKRKKIRN